MLQAAQRDGVQQERSRNGFFVAQLQAINVQRERALLESHEELSRTRQELHDMKQAQAQRQAEAATRRRQNAASIAQQIARVGWKLPVATYVVLADKRIVGEPNYNNHAPWPADFTDDPDRNVDFRRAPTSDVRLPLKEMTASGRKTGTLRRYLSPTLRDAKVGDCITIVGGPGPDILVRLTARGQLPFREVGQRHIEKEGLDKMGFDVSCGRAVLRRILSKTEGSWVTEDDVVWWIEWEVVDTI